MSSRSACAEPVTRTAPAYYLEVGQTVAPRQGAVKAAARGGAARRRQGSQAGVVGCRNPGQRPTVSVELTSRAKHSRQESNAMGLKAYHAKRKFDVTSEPRGR